MRGAETDRDAAANEAGFALLVAVLFLMAVTAVIAPFVLAARTSLDLASATLREDRLDLLADGLVTVLARGLAAPAQEAVGRAASVQSAPMLCRAGPLAIEARVQDQAGLVDLNSAESELLTAGFRALGLSPSAASDHAEAVIAYRQPTPEESGPMQTPGDGLVLDGFKHAPFEAVEELYDFPALQGLPLRTLAETFTIHSQQAQILGSRMSRRLSAILPERPSAPFPFIAEEGADSGPAVYRIDLFVRTADATVGYSGAIVTADGGEGGDFTFAERAVDPSVLPGGAAPQGAITSCDQLFGSQVAELLRGFTG